MNPEVRKQRLMMTKTGEKRIAYSLEEVVTGVIERGGSGFTLAMLKQFKESRVIPPSIFLWEKPYCTLRQITLLAEWMSGKLVAEKKDPLQYLYAHWHEPDKEE